jgi:hypothetical protein
MKLAALNTGFDVIGAILLHLGSSQGRAAWRRGRSHV